VCWCVLLVQQLNQQPILVVEIGERAAHGVRDRATLRQLFR